MSTKPHRKDIIVIAAVLVVAAVLMLIARVMPRTSLEDKVAEQTIAPDAIEYLDETAKPAAQMEETPGPEKETEAAVEPEQTGEAAAQPQQEAQVAGPMPAPQAQEVRGYAVITVNGRQYGDPIAMDRDKIITVKQEDGKINRVHITPDEVYMESSTCDNQDCVGEGNVTHDNYQTRILGTWIICLPNAVTIEYIPSDGD